MESLQMRPAKVHALAAGTTEAVGGALLTAGLATPAAAAALTGVMTTAIKKVYLGDRAVGSQRRLGVQRGPERGSRGARRNRTLATSCWTTRWAPNELVRPGRSARLRPESRPRR